MNGLINLDKPEGMSSAKAVGAVKRILGEKRVGHMGTLDPMACGVLVIGVGKSTRLFDYICGRKKTYTAKFSFGYTTDTLDMLGAVTETTADIPSVDAVLGAMNSMVGNIMQLPPQYSAKHVNGRRAYDLARNGIAPELKPVPVTVYSAELVCQPKMNEFVFEITCSAGTYIRSICRDAAKMCGSLATLSFLRRDRSGMFSLKDAVTLDELNESKTAAVIPPEDVLELPRFELDAALYEDLCLGRKIGVDLTATSMIYCNGEFFGIGVSENGVLKIKTYLRDS